MERKWRTPAKAMQAEKFCARRSGLSLVQKAAHHCPTFRFIAAELRHAGQSGNLTFHHTHWTRQDAPLLDELGAVIDHVKRLNTDGLETVENLVTACNKYHLRKNADVLEKWNTRKLSKFVRGKYGAR
jgi:RNA:NAD 2'-phosphotransferase (TPT1/KptA family)